ncbi:hypothetical protein K2173_001729 [Erythroxylum novogranatense]|uniref:FAS1 domain-containing protein n=1 Tax=Erythroxylum novogranatense TaxID=1862640 RepID=A0AAV8S8E7_9ROSI|nr:hypothetical protein K2173_001729 [Erythroxylum novogranatense]
MEIYSILLLCSTLLLFFTAPIYAQTSSPPAPTPTPTSSPSPAPAPAPAYVNLTHLLSVAGPYTTFLSYLESTKVIDTFQNQANNTEEGITVFVPPNQAFDSLKRPSLAKLTQDQLKQLMLFHALPHYYSLSDFKNLSQVGPATTFAGAGQFALNFTDTSGTVHLDSGWTRTKITSSMDSTDPVAIYRVENVLLPEAIFGTNIPPVPAPASAPETSPAADSPAADASAKIHAPGTSPPSSSHRIINLGVWSQMVFAVSGVLVLLL